MNESSKIIDLAEVFDTDFNFPKEYYALGTRIKEIKNQIIEESKNKEKTATQLTEMYNNYEEMNCTDNDKYFKYGFCLAVQIMCEAFSLKIK